MSLVKIVIDDDRAAEIELSLDHAAARELRHEHLRQLNQALGHVNAVIGGTPLGYRASLSEIETQEGFAELQDALNEAARCAVVLWYLTPEEEVTPADVG